jgi:hypothetical protein
MRVPKKLIPPSFVAQAKAYRVDLPQVVRGKDSVGLGHR